MNQQIQTKVVVKMVNEGIRNVQGLLDNYIGPNRKVVDVQVGPLVAAGENYSAIIYKLDVKLQNKSNAKEEWIHAAAKLIPANEKARIMCDIQVSVKKEIAMFDTILPVLQEFQRENGVEEVVDYLPELYGWRLNLHKDNDVVDDDAVIAMENMKEAGYVNVDRFVGLDLDTTKIILKDLAAFHALPIALKLKKPDVFQGKIKPFLTPHKHPPRPKSDKPQSPSPDSLPLEILEKEDKCKPYLLKVKELLAKDVIIHVPPREPFASISHADLWINNVMVKFENNKPVKSKIIDFQFYDYKSPARDLFFFLFTSVQKKVLEEKFDYLVKFYHDHFVSYLKEMRCDTEPFGLDKFLEELRTSAILEYKHTIIFILMVVMGKGGPSPGFYPGGPMNLVKIMKNMSPDAKEKACMMTCLCGEKGWL